MSLGQHVTLQAMSLIIAATLKHLEFHKVSTTIVLHLFSPSDIDLVVVGLWESLPLRTLERRLLERNIADPATIKVLYWQQKRYIF